MLPIDWVTETVPILCLILPPPQFIEARLEKLNTGEGFSDQFEQEITCCRASSGEP
jgi:hypothetical protein